MTNPTQPVKRRIMVVDDERVLAELTARMLEKLGYRCTRHTDSSEALADFTARPEDFDLVLTDMTMPGISGEKLAEMIQRARPGIPVIVCTGHSKKLQEKSPAEFGVDAILMKPLQQGRLAGTVRSVLDRKRS